MQKGPLKFWRSEKGALKNYDDFTPENWVYMIFCEVNACFPWEKWGALKIFAVQKGGGGLKIFHAEVF